ncbi:hypothetical protein M2323_004456 [Rhodoblastus acidophilus]|uniref:hypothetical protein n=1 Tax=Rhodoblastus acidophilus TaxID=1074 RepID=UPI002225915B|nr:hypothetical protein [Rhodoblastus acidophilus]MCW2286687.1 hypothetical protein [Rhodoblastus acidophilus]MCW2335507.1 hypothetical protein [Rhodoblastus acidophilus]
MHNSKPVTAAAARAAALRVEEIEDTQGNRARVITARASGLDHLRLHDRLTKTAIAAGERFTALYEAASGPGVKSVDWGAVRVDCAKRSYGPAEYSFKALQTLLDVQEKLGGRAFFLLTEIAGKGRGLTDVAVELAAREGIGKQAAQGYVTERLREALNDLANHWGAAQGPAHAAIRAQHSF